MKIPTVTVNQMREVDRLMVEEFGIEIMQMMENAGHIVARIALKLYPNSKHAVCLAGKGNNGGDALVTARYLHNAGIKTEVVLADNSINELSQHQLNVLKKLNIPISNEIKSKPDFFIDGLLGYNTKGAPRGNFATIIQDAIISKAPVICFDQPSGLELETYTWHKPAFENADVVTLALPKKGMLKDNKINKLFVGDLGIPKEVYAKIGINVPNLFKERDYFEIK